MTGVAFHFNAPDPLVYACRFLRKAVSAGAKVVVTGVPGTLAQLDAVLWTFSPSDFVSHCFVTDQASLVNSSSVVLAPSIASVPHL